MTDRAGLDIGLETVSSGAGVLDLSRRLLSGAACPTIGADGKSDDQRKLSTG